MNLYKSISIFAILLTASVSNAQVVSQPIVIDRQGSFMAGGSTITAPGKYSHEHFTAPDGQTAYGDHAYAFYQIPVNSHPLPLVMLHGGGQTGKTWETTPDGREGFQNIFLRKGYGVYVIDQPRRGRASASLSTVTVGPEYSAQRLFSLFRIGDNGEVFSGSQFPADSATIEQLHRQATPDTGEYDDEVTSDAMAAVFEKTGPAILVSHSRGGYPGFLTALKSDNVKAIISFEPGGSPFIFPEGEKPEGVPTAYGILDGVEVPMSDFMKLTKIPIIIYYGDFIAEKPVSHVGMDQWRGEMEMARKFAEAVNRHGGDATVIHLPEIGIKGNTHFLMADKNNLEIANLMDEWINAKGLEK